MKIEQIYSLWEVDSKINSNDLSMESLRISELHHKYFQIFTNERLILRKHEMDLKILKKEKFDFFTFGPTKETQEKNWKLPPSGKILKSDVQFYIDSDRDVIDLTLKVGIQNEKIELLDSIIKSLNARSFNIKNAIEYMKFQAGIA